jgi:hypothetical protein
MTTPKQDRNGVPGPGATGGNVSQPGPDYTGEIRSAAAKAQADQNARKSADYLNVPASTGVTPWDKCVGRA